MRHKRSSKNKTIYHIMNQDIFSNDTMLVKYSVHFRNHLNPSTLSVLFKCTMTRASCSRLREHETSIR